MSAPTDPSDSIDPAAPRAGESPDPRREALGALGVFAASTAACAVLWQLRRVVPFVQRHLHAFIAAIFLYVPTMLISRAREDFDEYALTHRPVKRGLLVYLIAVLIVFPPFAVGMLIYYRLVCGWVGRGVAMPAVYQRMCRRFVSDWRAVRWRLPAGFGQTALAQVIVVALPEEYFFRGYLQTRLGRAWPSRRRLFGAPFGWSVVLTQVLFALGHVLVDFNGLRLAVFFPGLLFGWMRQATGSILAGVLFHASSNLISELLHSLLF